LIGVEPEVIQCAPANRICALVLRKSFAVPSDGGVARRVIVGPRRAAIALAPWDVVICPTRFLRRRVKVDVSDGYSWSHRHSERLNSAIEILVVERVFIVPDASIGTCDFVTHEPDPVVAVIRLDLVYGRTVDARPGHDGRLLLYRLGGRAKIEIRRPTADSELTVRNIIKHVAFSRVRLAPGVFSIRDVLGFGEISRARILRRNQVAGCDCNPVRRPSMRVTTMVVCSRWEFPGKWIYPGTRTDASLAGI